MEAIWRGFVQFFPVIGLVRWKGLIERGVFIGRGDLQKIFNVEGGREWFRYRKGL